MTKKEIRRLVNLTLPDLTSRSKWDFAKTQPVEYVTEHVLGD